MASFLVLDVTGEGQTETVANRIADSLVGRGHDTAALDAEVAQGEPTVADVDGGRLEVAPPGAGATGA